MLKQISVRHLIQVLFFRNMMMHIHRFYVTMLLMAFWNGYFEDIDSKARLVTYHKPNVKNLAMNN